MSPYHSYASFFSLLCSCFCGSVRTLLFLCRRLRQFKRSSQTKSRNFRTPYTYCLSTTSCSRSGTHPSFGYPGRYQSSRLQQNASTDLHWFRHMSVSISSSIQANSWNTSGSVSPDFAPPRPLPYQLILLWVCTNDFQWTYHSSHCHPPVLRPASPPT